MKSNEKSIKLMETQRYNAIIDANETIISSVAIT